MSIAPARKPSSNDVARRLRDEIVAGRLPAGQRLTEAELTQRFSVGRGVIREALGQLAHQGLVISKRNCGATVAPEAPKAVRTLITPVRRTIEVYALKLVFHELSETDFSAWERVLAEMRDACTCEDLHAIAEADLAFHRYLLDRAGQPDLIIMWDTLVGRLRSHFHRMQRRCSRLLDIYDEHSELLDSFRGQDQAAAVRLLRSRID